IFRSHGLKVVGVPLTTDGLDLEQLEALVAEHRPRLLYTIPTFQNPSGHTLDAGQRRELVDLAERGDFLVVADEVYQHLSFGDAVLPSFGTLVDSCRVMSLGSFSKILAPGLRLGWVHADQGLLGALEGSGMLVSGGGISPFTAAMVRGVLDLGLLGPSLDRLRRTYAGRAACLADALRQLGPGTLSFEEPAGGYFIWASLPAGLSSAALLKVARERGVEFKPGGLFSLTQAQEGRLRLCFSYYDEEPLREGARRLGAALHDVLGAGETGAS
ncbi:MAG: PLP-dependent aminotransferase family protein, partial [Deinococcus sp.]